MFLGLLNIQYQFISYCYSVTKYLRIVQQSECLPEFPISLTQIFRALASMILMLSLNAFNNQQPLSFHIHIWKKKNQPTLTCPCGQHTTPWSDPPTSPGSSGTGLLPSEVKGRRWTAFLVCSLTGHNHHTERNFLLC